MSNVKRIRPATEPSTGTERTKPMKMHKNLVIRVLTDHPEDLAQLCPDWKGTAAEFVAALEADPRQWIVGGELVEEPR